MRNEGIDNKMTAATADWQTAASPGPDDARYPDPDPSPQQQRVCRLCSESSRSSHSSYSTSSRYRDTDSGLSEQILTLSNSSSLAVTRSPGPRLAGSGGGPPPRLASVSIPGLASCWAIIPVYRELYR